jgi:hypothetical protein
MLKFLFSLKDIFKFLVIFVVIFLGFLLSINNLYWYFSPSVRSSVEVIEHLDPENNTETNAERAFGT